MVDPSIGAVESDCPLRDILVMDQSPVLRKIILAFEPSLSDTFAAGKRAIDQLSPTGPGVQMGGVAVTVEVVPIFEGR